MDLKEHILNEADKLFCTYGIKSITMDDIAHHLGISKKTIYVHFKDKNEMVMLLIQKILDSQRCVIDTKQETSANAVEEVFMAVTELQDLLSNMNPMFINDLQKYHPEAWKVFQEFRNKKLFEVITANLHRGIAEGYYRKDIQPDILARLRIEEVGMAFNPAVFSANNYSYSAIMTELTEHFLFGVCNLKGHRLINQYKQLNEEE